MSFRVQRISILEVLEIANIRVHHIARIVYRHSKLQFGNSSAHLQWTKMRKKNCLKGYNQNIQKIIPIWNIPQRDLHRVKNFVFPFLASCIML